MIVTNARYPTAILLTLFIVIGVVVPSVDGFAAQPETKQISLANEGVLNIYARWAANLRKISNPAKAGEVEARAKMLKHAFRSPESTYLGFDPSKDLKEYGDSLPGERYRSIYAVADSYNFRQTRNVKSWGAKVRDRFRYYAPKAYEGFLNAEQTKNLFSGNVLDDEWGFTVWYNADGNYLLEKGDFQTKGKWWVDKDGMYCVGDTRQIANCVKVQKKSGREYIYHRDDGSTTVVTFRN